MSQQPQKRSKTKQLEKKAGCRANNEGFVEQPVKAARLQGRLGMRHERRSCLNKYVQRLRLSWRGSLSIAGSTKFSLEYEYYLRGQEKPRFC
jgi:hypothetical protein